MSKDYQVRFLNRIVRSMNLARDHRANSVIAASDVVWASPGSSPLPGRCRRQFGIYSSLPSELGRFLLTEPSVGKAHDSRRVPPVSGRRRQQKRDRVEGVERAASGLPRECRTSGGHFGQV